MLENIVKKEIIFIVMGMLLGLGVLAKMVSTLTVRKIVKAAGEIHKSNHKLMKLVKAKFEHASMISDRVQNVEAFVDKYIYEYKVLGIRLNTWRTLPQKILLLIGILGIFAIFESYRIVGFGSLMLEYLQWTGLFIMFLALIYFVAEDSSRLQAAKNYMVEYLENVCINRYAKKHKEMEVVENAEPEIKEEEAVEVSAPIEEIQEEVQKKSEQEMRIRAILEEFLA